jgi:hypothetical protein
LNEASFKVSSFEFQVSSFSNLTHSLNFETWKDPNLRSAKLPVMPGSFFAGGPHLYFTSSFDGAPYLPQLADVGEKSRKLPHVSQTITPTRANVGHYLGSSQYWN